MRICILEAVDSDRVINRDYNAGLGTAFRTGVGVRARLLRWLRRTGEQLPLMVHGYVAALLKEGGHEVIAVTNRVPQGVDLVLFHPTLVQQSMEMALLRRIRKESSARIGLFGRVVSLMPELFDGLADFLITGEPERVIRELARTGMLPEGQVHSESFTDLDELPFPDWTPFPHQRYRCFPTLSRWPVAFVQASRGCPYTCAYCPYIVQTRYRHRRVEKVIEELRHLKEHYGVRSVIFRDPVFSLNRKRVLALCQAMMDADLDLEWLCETRVDRVDVELLEVMHRAGMRAMKIGVESSSEEILKHARRRSAPMAHQEEIAQRCQELGIRLVAFFILGLPFDTLESMEQTIQYATKLPSWAVNFTVYTPLPGTPYFDELKDRIYDQNWEHYDNFHVVYEHEHLTTQQIEDAMDRAFNAYFFRPSFWAERTRGLVARGLKGAMRGIRG